MGWAKKIGISLTVMFFAVCCGLVLLFNWNAFGFKALSVPTGSMRPNINPGSLVLMHRVPLSSLKVGDVITYTNPETMKSTVSHRIIKEFKLDGKVPAFVTKGDANPTADPWTVVGGLVQGKVIAHVPFLGKVMIWSKTWTGIALLIYIPALLLIIEEIQRLTEYYKKFIPYRIFGYLPVIKKNVIRQKLAQSTALAVGLIIAASALALPAEAMLSSNTVTLGPNHITVAAKSGGSGSCSGNSNNNTNINVNNSSTQTATSGNVNSSGNTTSGNTSSGSASNNNSSTTTITVTNC